MSQTCISYHLNLNYLYSKYILRFYSVDLWLKCICIIPVIEKKEIEKMTR